MQQIGTDMEKIAMYIEKYWGNYIGGTDDSLTLLDYLMDKQKSEISLSEIFADRSECGDMHSNQTRELVNRFLAFDISIFVYASNRIEKSLSMSWWQLMYYF